MNLIGNAAKKRFLASLRKEDRSSDILRADSFRRKIIQCRNHGQKAGMSHQKRNRPFRPGRPQPLRIPDILQSFYHGPLKYIVIDRSVSKNHGSPPAF